VSTQSAGILFTEHAVNNGRAGGHERLLRVVQPDHPDVHYARRSLSILRSKDKTLNIASQNLIEFWAVATRPKSKNGLGLQGSQARAEIQTMKGLFSVLPELPLQNAWQRLVVDHGVSGKSTHDAHLVAAMIVNGIGSILTFNAQDFLRYSEILVLDPRKL
jgi:predicted nucleic acid-binding protein